MRKKTLLTLTALVVVMGGLCLYLTFHANALIERCRPDLERAAARALGRPVAFGDLAVGLLPTPRISIGAFKLGGREAPRGISFKRLLVHLDPWPLFQGKLDITRLELTGARLVLIKDRDGLKVEGLSAAPAAEERSAADKPSSARRPPPAAPLEINLKAAALNDAEVVLRDAATGREYLLSALHADAALAATPDLIRIERLRAEGQLDGVKAALRASNAVYKSNPASFDAGATALVIAGNTLALKGSFAFSEKQGRFSAVSSSITLESLAPLLEQFAPRVKSFQLKGKLQPDVQIELAPAGAAVTGQAAVSGFSAAADGRALSDGAGTLSFRAAPQSQDLQVDDLRIKLDGSSVKAGLKLERRGDQVKIEGIDLLAFSGSVQGSAALGLGAAKAFSTRLRLSGLQLEPLLRAVNPAAAPQISGTLAAAEIDLSGQPGPDLKRSLRGKAALTVKDAELKGFNLAAKVLQAVTDLPFLAGPLYAVVPESEKRSLSADRTAITSLSASFAAAGGSLHTPDLTAVTPLFRLRAQGGISLAAALDLNSQIAFTPGFSAALAAKVKELKYMFNHQGEFELPLRISGTPPEILVVPDLSRLLKSAAGQAVIEKAETLLDRALGGKSAGGAKRGGSLKKLLGF